MLKAKTGGGFDKVVQMVDNMIAVLVKEQADDDKKKDYCHSELDKSADQEKALKGEVSDIGADISEKEDTLSTITSEIETLQSGIAALDKMVAEATEQRKEEHAEYTAAVTSNSACQQLIEMAKNRLNKFYNPSLYKAPETTTESSSPYGFVQIAQHMQIRSSSDLGEAPETFSGEYKKSEGSTGIIAMMSQMAKDVEMDTKEAKHDEEDAQKDYTETMKEAATKRSDDSKLIVQKEGAKASLAEELATARELLNSKRGRRGRAEGLH